MGSDVIRNTVRVRYLRGEPTTSLQKGQEKVCKGVPVGCIAYQIDWDKQVVYYGISCQNKHDLWNREMALSLAKGRLLARRDSCHEFYFDEEKPKINELLHDIFLSWLEEDDEERYEGMEMEENIPLRLRRMVPVFLDNLKQEETNDPRTGSKGSSYSEAVQEINF